MGRLTFFNIRSKSFWSKSSIGRRWLLNGVGIVLLVLLLILIGFSIAIRSSFYASARQIIRSTADTTISILQHDTADTLSNMADDIRDVVENFDQKDNMTIMVINHEGHVILNSNGFDQQVDADVPDYERALTAEDGVGTYEGKLPTGEHVIAVTRLLPLENSEYAALRFVASTRLIDNTVLRINLIFAVICLAILLCVLISGAYFINSIVIPVQRIGVATRKIATGDYNTRIIKDKDDELGQLCDTINYMAEELAMTEKVKNEFISSVSHELRTPLTAIKGWGETLALSSAQDVETIRKGMHVIVSETGRLSEMVEELLDFSRLQSGNFALQKARMDVLAELGEAVLIYAERARRDGITLLYNEPVMLPFVYGDRNRLKQVFINIIDNAVKYSDAGGTVTVSASAGEDFVELTVSDTGCGINAADLSHVTEKFFKANHLRRGSGIGLAVANEIVVMHDGELLIRSTEGVGTTVTIKLPILREEPVLTDEA